ncbi:hypothetical protein [Duganella sp. Root1480D1]|uniref:hypothetical protein n=1 Tax=Duganella sp. Root1480D1 TaxID=1736471 RepID=UPI00070FBC9D|nr:hypothetical protein [Duganella sp. Root1480D1]KQZ26928.1 hypothetical protein ASD58_15175 [Duganella sp. Root1480D1]
MTKPSRFRRFEALVWLIVGLVLLTVFLSKVSFYTKSAEERAIDVTLSQLRAAVEMHRLRSTAAATTLEGSNPMQLLAVKPANYLGEFASRDSAPVQPGTWFFDRQSEELVYVLLAPEKSSLKQQQMLYFKLELRRLPEPTVRPSEPPAANAGVVLNQLDD